MSGIFDAVRSVLNTRLFTLSKTDVTLASFLIFFIIILTVSILARFFSRKLLVKVTDRLHIQEGTRFIIRRITEYVLTIIGVIIAFQTIGVNLSSLAVIFGLLSVGIGFGLQNITSNLISGFILFFEQPIRVGDRITVGGTEGDVKEINIRATKIRTLSNIFIIVPNSEFVSQRVINWSHGDPEVRIDIAVGVSYNSDLDTVIKAMEEVAEENKEILTDPKPEVQLRSFGDSSWNMELRVWVRDPKRHKYIESEVNFALIRKFRKYGVEIPFPQRDLHLRSSIPIPLDSLKKESNRK
ncbi:MAG: mechanosensitive ion channel [Acidobacteria bacterium]|nr:mechanosensitive ion channel [Acidobacteriota bacterium]MBU4329315.1 mechanosensitive ion channel [Acidobacteriota bacterium]MBU4495749.1 mechanosensitive ion channel [Acidobacteriota bacterium]MCG2816044.1 mechanosensitive ion channel [Candidatus Aminicenantes bacterium]